MKPTLVALALAAVFALFSGVSSRALEGNELPEVGNELQDEGIETFARFVQGLERGVPQSDVVDIAEVDPNDVDNAILPQTQSMERKRCTRWRCRVFPGPIKCWCIRWG